MPIAVWHAIKLCIVIFGIVIFAIMSIASKQDMADFLKEQVTAFDDRFYGATLAGFFMGLFAAAGLENHISHLLLQICTFVVLLCNV